MLVFEKIDDTNISGLKRYFDSDGDILICDYTFGVTYIWHGLYGYEYATIGGLLFLKTKSFEGETVFSFPIGKGDVLRGLDEIAYYAAYNEIPLMFAPLDDRQLAVLKKHFGLNAGIKAEFNRKWYDYLYNIKDLMTFSGGKYHGQKNHINKFVKTYEYSFCDIKDVSKDKLTDFLERFKEKNPCNDETSCYEIEKIRGLIESDREVLKGGAILIGGIVAAFSYGEIVGDTLFVHIEKALTEYTGIYPVIVKEFANFMYQNGVKYINREEDMGLPGLRISKLAYHPIGLLEKAAVRLDGSNYIPLDLSDGYVRIRELKLCDQMEYAVLASDAVRNRYWGYDYRKDVKGVADERFFIEQTLLDRERGEEYSYAVCLDGTDTFIGEIVLHNFIGFSAEMGIRLLKDFEGNGYAARAFRLLSGFLLEKGYFKQIRAKCFKENLKSEKMILSAGFQRRDIKEDEYSYFMIYGRKE